MKKGQPPELFEELTLPDTEDHTPKGPAKFAGTDNPRDLRVISALLTRPRKREDVDRAAGCSNGPDLIMRLRRLGLEIKCDKVPAIDRDGFPIRFGVYHFTNDDRRKLTAWQRLRDEKGRA